MDFQNYYQSELSYLRDVSYYIDAALALALLALTSTLVAARYVTRGGPF